MVPIVPNHWADVDRNGVVLNQPLAYTLEIKPSGWLTWTRPSDELGKIVQVSASDRRRFMKMRKESKSFPRSLPLRSRLSDEEVARFTAQRLPWRRDPGAAVPQLSLWRSRQPRRLHRTDQLGPKSSRWKSG